MSMLQDYIGLVLVVGLLLGIYMAVRSGIEAWQRSRKLDSGKRAMIDFGWSLVHVLIAGFVVMVFGSFVVDMGPALIEQTRMKGQPAPEMRFARVENGVMASLADHRGDVVLLNLWATWCPPCRAELPDLDKLQATYRDRGLVVLQISDEPREILTRFLQESPMRTEHGYVESFSWPAAGRPTTYVIDREGIIRKAFLGARSYEQFESAIVEHL